MPAIPSRPAWVWCPADHRMLGEPLLGSPYLLLGDQYARAIKEGAQAQPVMFPLADGAQVPELLAQVDGVLLTGSASNVHPAHFAEPVADPSLPLDPERDQLTLSLVRACLDQAVPLLGICRGFQEINVALGGSLHQRVHAVAGLLDHRAPAGPQDERYAARHDVQLVAGSCFERWAGASVARVNSLHGQGIARLAPGLRALAYGPDGLIEAFDVVGATSFACAVQWHPEWRFAEHVLYAALWQAFGAAVRQRQQARTLT